ncbi:T9SS type A sorting domain-containing protein [Polaribacter sp. Hel1_85]|uniref:T9SS type A sorting domain-containing protein n=1 Tax=Polaribacter sp. Hel1_85 TaxID=1250005 RepID=UPI00052B5379|nr:T9SS type A sorting domain-containing protein [Polaribacter sp. Hel1_85]KGL59129.1 hypothetical protein PHEL85_3403 [Polaribacter sp. Hel1_85]
MKKKYYLILGVAVFFLASAFTTYIAVIQEYEISDVSDLSFQERVVYHDDEIHSLENYYTNVTSNTVIVNDYNSVMTEFEDVILQQKQYMVDNNITLEQVRNNPSILPVNFQISDLQYSKIINIVNTVKPDSSPQLSESLTTLNEYVDLAREPSIKYSQLEIYEDASGEDLLNPYQFKGNTSKKKGLKSKEAVRKLRDLLKIPLKLTEGKISVYPNPFTEFSKISFINTVKGNVLFSIYDLNGKKIFSTLKEVEQGTVTVNSQDILKEKLAKGLFILKIKNSEGKVLTHKIISK